MPKIKSIVKKPATFTHVKKWYDTNLHPDANNYDDPEVYKHVYHEGRWPSVFQATSGGAQRLFQKAKPESVVDIAALTSIYRPGPLASNVDKLWVEHRNEQKRFDWGHPLFGEILKDTNGFLIFQESIMKLLEHIGNFPKTECDAARRALLKRDASKQEAAMQEARAMEQKFIDGASTHGIPEYVSREAYKKIIVMGSYCFNRGHAVGYSILSYICAYLFTKYPEQWLTAYLESHSHDPIKKAVAFGVVKSLGYQIVSIDVNEATASWRSLPGKRFMPSFLSCKGIGATAIEELLQNRPFSSLEDMLWNADGSWKHSKFNKRSLEALIKIQALASLNPVGEGCLFKTWKQLYHVVIENYDEIKKTSKRDAFRGKKKFFELISQSQDMGEWSKEESVQHSIDVFDTLDVNLLVSPAIIKQLEDKGVVSIENLEEGENKICWFVWLGCAVKKTKNDKSYLIAQTVGPSGKPVRMNVWGWKGPKKPDPYTVCLAEVERNSYGHSTKWFKLKLLSEQQDA